MASQDIALIAHLLRRAGFGATRGELEEHAAKGYEATVEELLNFGEPQTMSDYLVRRYHHEYSAMMDVKSPQAVWLYRMISTTAPLQEKIALFWHGIFRHRLQRQSSPGQSTDGPDQDVPAVRIGQLQNAAD